MRERERCIHTHIHDTHMYIYIYMKQCEINALIYPLLSTRRPSLSATYQRPVRASLWLVPCTLCARDKRAFEILQVFVATSKSTKRELVKYCGW